MSAQPGETLATAKEEAKSNAPRFLGAVPDDSTSNANIDLDDLFNDIYMMDFAAIPPGTGLSESGESAPAEVAPDAAAAAVAVAPTPVAAAPVAAAVAAAPAAVPVVAPAVAPAAVPAAPTEAAPAAAPAETAGTKRSVAAAGLDAAPPDAVASAAAPPAPSSAKAADLTEQQKLERRERNREHAKRSRLRKKFLLESLQEQIHELEEQIDRFKEAIKKEIPDRAQAVIAKVCGDKETYTPLPMPSGFGPVKTLMEPDFRLMSALSGSQQNFAISDPTLADNPIVYVSQGFLDLTGYTLDQVLGRNCRFLQGPGTDQSAVQVIRKGIAEGVDTSVCLLNYKADGTPFWNQFFVAALRDADNNVVNYVGVQCEVSKAVVEKQIRDKGKKAIST